MSDVQDERFQSKITSLKEGIVFLYNTKLFSDLEFLVQQELIKAHKLIVATRCPRFNNLLLSPKAPECIIIDDESVTFDGFDLLLQFIYKDAIDCTVKRKIVEAYLAAVYCEQQELQDKCKQIIDIWEITVDEFCNLFEFGAHFPALRERCIDFMENNGLNVIKAPSFFEQSLRGLCNMLKWGALEKVPVLERINAVMLWFVKKMESNPIDYKQVRNTLETTDTSLLGKLHFEELTILELADVLDKYNGLITYEENAKFMIYQKRKDASILPEWCLKPKIETN